MKSSFPVVNYYAGLFHIIQCKQEDFRDLKNTSPGSFREFIV